MKKIAFVMGSFHKNYITEMLAVAKETATNLNLEVAQEVWVPGSMEKPLAVKRLLMNDEIAGLVVLGIIEKGETKHGLVMANAVINSIIQLQLEFMKPIGVGILGPEIKPSQIPSRIEPYAKSAVFALSEMINQNVK